MAALLCAIGWVIHKGVMDHEEKQQMANYNAASRHPRPSEERSRTAKGETLREKASRKIHGKGANPSQLGDPISIKAETSDRVPTDGEAGAGSSEETLVPDRSDERSEGSSARGSTPRRVGEAGRNPTLLGDPISIHAETSSGTVRREEEDAGNSSRGSKL